MDRRNFIKLSSFFSSGLVLGISACSENAVIVDETQKNDNAFNAFLKISDGGEIIVVCHKSEMGQDIHTGLAMIIAEELESNWDDVKIENAPADAKYYHTKWGPFQGTGASSSISSTWEQIRNAAATAKAMLISAAAKKWGADSEACYAENSVVINRLTSERLTYAELASTAKDITPPENVTYKPPEDYKIIGTSVKRIERNQKNRGAVTYGIDVSVDDMLASVVIRPPVFGATLESFDLGGMEKVIQVFTISGGLAVVGKDYWQVKQALNTIKVAWNTHDELKLDTDEIYQSFLDDFSNPGLDAKENISPEFSSAQPQITSVYKAPYLAHAAMEPLNCVAHVTEDRCDIWTGSQMQTSDQNIAMKITGLPREKVHVHTVYLGGSFGRRANPASDFVQEAVEIAKQLDKPVKVYWSREDDMKSGYYRPIFVGEMKAVFDAEKNLSGIGSKIASQSIVRGTDFEKKLTHHGIDHLSVEGAVDQPYSFSNYSLKYYPQINSVPVLWWRAVGHTTNAFALESFIDEIAVFKNVDPFEFRASLLKDQQRHLKVLKELHRLSKWGSYKEDNLYRGIALHKSFGSVVGQVVDLRVVDNKIDIETVYSVVDCGLVINPENVKDQIVSGAIYGLSAALFNQIDIKEGQVVQGNFHDYRILRNSETPEFITSLIPSTESPKGVGEISTPPVVPALTNAIFLATGERVRQLPIKLTNHRII